MQKPKVAADDEALQGPPHLSLSQGGGGGGGGAVQRSAAQQRPIEGEYSTCHRRQMTRAQQSCHGASTCTSVRATGCGWMDGVVD